MLDVMLLPAVLREEGHEYAQLQIASSVTDCICLPNILSVSSCLLTCICCEALAESMRRCNEAKLRAL